MASRSSSMERRLNNMKDVIALLDCHNSPELGELTSARPLASTSFLGRYAFADFALSNFCNSEIQNVGILVKDHQRSILKHMGNMMSWVVNTKIGHETIFYNEKGQLNPAYNSDINNIKENDWVLYDSDASVIVFASAHIILDIDLRPIFAEHIARHEDMTDDEKLKKGIIYEVPSGLIFKNDLLSNIGPKIPVKISMRGSILSNIDTSITNYGINNALVKVNVNLTLNEQVLLPFTLKTIEVDTSIPVVIKMVEGTVPKYYSGSLSNTSPQLSIPLEEN